MTSSTCTSYPNCEYSDCTLTYWALAIPTRTGNQRNGRIPLSAGRIRMLHPVNMSDPDVKHNQKHIGETHKKLSTRTFSHIKIK